MLLVALVNFKGQLVYDYSKLLYFFKVKSSSLLFTAVQNPLILLGWNSRKCLACCLVFSSLWTDVVLSPPEYFKAAQVNSLDSISKSTCRFWKANNLNCKAEKLKSQVAFVTGCSVRAGHTKQSPVALAG